MPVRSDGSLTSSPLGSMRMARVRLSRPHEKTQFEDHIISGSKTAGPS